MIKNFATGLGFLARGLGFVTRNPRLAMMGMVPPLIVSTVMAVGLIVFASLALVPLTTAATGWVPDAWRTAAEIVIGILIMVLAIGLAAITFTSITLVVGAPVYEKISAAVDKACGGTDVGPQEKFIASAWRGIGQGLAVIALSILLAIPVFVVGLVPVIGSVVAAIGGAMVGGTLVMVELIGGPYDRRGLRRLGDKFAASRGQRFTGLGFGVPVFLLFSIPLVSVVLFPVATAGATLLARHLRGESTVEIQPSQ